MIGNNMLNCRITGIRQNLPPFKKVNHQPKDISKKIPSMESIILSPKAVQIQ